MKTKTQKMLIKQLVKAQAPNNTKSGLAEGRRRVAGLLGISLAYVYQIESGDIAPSRPLVKLMKYFNDKPKGTAL